MRVKISVKIAKRKEPHQNLYKGQFFQFYPLQIRVIIGRRLPDKVIYRIRLYIKANKDIVVITDVIKVLKKIIYKLRLNLNI